MTWVWNYTSAEPGLYDIRLTLSNLQGTADVTTHAAFEIGDDMVRLCEADGRRCGTIIRTQEVPALFVLVPLLGAFTVFRRTRGAHRG